MQPQPVISHNPSDPSERPVCVVSIGKPLSFNLPNPNSLQIAAVLILHSVPQCEAARQYFTFMYMNFWNMVGSHWRTVINNWEQFGLLAPENSLTFLACQKQLDLFRLSP